MRLTDSDMVQVRWFQIVFQHYLKRYWYLKCRHELAFIKAIQETCDRKVKHNLLKKDLIQEWKAKYRKR